MHSRRRAVSLDDRVASSAIAFARRRAFPADLLLGPNAVIAVAFLVCEGHQAEIAVGHGNDLAAIARADLFCTQRPSCPSRAEPTCRPTAHPHDIASAKRHSRRRIDPRLFPMRRGSNPGTRGLFRTSACNPKASSLRKLQERRRTRECRESRPHEKPAAPAALTAAAESFRSSAVLAILLRTDATLRYAVPYLAIVRALLRTLFARALTRMSGSHPKQPRRHFKPSSMHLRCSLSTHHGTSLH